MNPERLLQHFDQIAEAPDAVPRLRRFILDLAVRGKLVEQNPEDEPASELLKRIEAAKTQRANEGKIRKPRYLPPIKREEESFQLPETWLWVRIGNVFDYDAGSKTEPKHLLKDAWLLELEDIEKDSGKIVQHLTVADRLPKSTKSGFQPGDVLYGKLRPYLNKVVVVDSPGFSTTEIVVLRCYGELIPQYTCLALRRPDFVDYVTRLGQGTKMPRLRTEDAVSAPFPLPPLAEQHRIVAKVGELMSLCDELEAAQAKREKRRDRLVAATLYGLNNGDVRPQPDTCPTFEESARFYFNHIPRLTTRPEHIQKLRQTLLSLAVRGKLVPQDQNDEPVAVFLQRIDQERAITAKIDRRADIDFQKLLAGELCWRVPANWGWRGVADLVLFIDYRGKTPAKTDSGIRLITAKNVRRGFINLAPEEFVTETTYNGWMTRGFPREGDILFTTEAPMGNAAVVRLQEKFGLAQRVINFRPYGDIDSDFLVLQMLSEPFQAILDKTATGLTAKGIKATKLKRLPLAVPPLAEQHRIVAKMDELMALCDKLEAQINSIDVSRRQFHEATLQETLGT